MRTLMAKRNSSERRGVAAVEMAFIFPVFMLLVLGIIEFGRFMMVGQLLTNSAREGARMAISGYFSEAEIRADIESFLLESANIPASDLTLTITTETGAALADAASKELITVSVDVRFVDVSYLPMLDNPGGGTNDPLSGLRHDATKVMTGVSSMRKE